MQRRTEAAASAAGRLILRRCLSGAGSSAGRRCTADGSCVRSFAGMLRGFGGARSPSSTTSRCFLIQNGLREIAMKTSCITTISRYTPLGCAPSHPAHPIASLDSIPRLRQPPARPQRLRRRSVAAPRSASFMFDPSTAPQVVLLDDPFGYDHASWLCDC